MSLNINTNITSITAQGNLSKTSDALSKTIQRLSSGMRVNSAADDASGYAIATRMDAQIRGMAVASRNANDGISFSQTTSGALAQISNNLQRMRELAIQAGNGSNSASDTQLLNQEFVQLQNEVNRIQSSTTFNNVNVFSATDTVFQIGANTTTNDRFNMQGAPLTTTASLGTQTITDRSNISANAAIGAVITAAGAATGATLSSVFNATLDAINGSQDLSFAAKNDAVNTLTAINNAYNAAGLSAVPATAPSVANFVTDLQKAVGTTAAVLTPYTLTVGLAAAAASTGTFVADGNPSNPTNPVTTTAAATTLKVNISVTSVGTAGTAGTLLATQTTSSGQANAQNAIEAIDSALTEVNNQSSIQGAMQNRFSAVISNLSAFSQSQTASKSRIMDADFATETANLSKYQILSQAGTAMLAQANQLNSSVLNLLKQ
jgi:flagellin